MSFSGSSPAFAVGKSNPATPGSTRSEVFSEPSSAGSKGSVTFADSPDTVRLSPEQENFCPRRVEGHSNGGHVGHQHAVYIEDLDDFTAKLESRLSGIEGRAHISSLVAEILAENPSQPAVPSGRKNHRPQAQPRPKQHAIHSLARTVSGNRRTPTNVPTPNAPADDTDSTVWGPSRRPMSREQRRKADYARKRQQQEQIAREARNPGPRGRKDSWSFADGDATPQWSSIRRAHSNESYTDAYQEGEASVRSTQSRQSNGQRPPSRPTSVPSEPGEDEREDVGGRARLRSRPAPVRIPKRGKTGIEMLAKIIAPDTLSRRRPGSASR